MNKKYCDRCGAEITDSKYGWLRRTLFFSTHRLISSGREWKDDDKEICPACEEQYIQWFLHPEKDKGE